MLPLCSRATNAPLSIPKMVRTWRLSRHSVRTRRDWHWGTRSILITLRCGDSYELAGDPTSLPPGRAGGSKPECAHQLRGWAHRYKLQSSSRRLEGGAGGPRRPSYADQEGGDREEPPGGARERRRGEESVQTDKVRLCAARDRRRRPGPPRSIPTAAVTRHSASIHNTTLR